MAAATTVVVKIVVIIDLKIVTIILIIIIKKTKHRKRKVICFSPTFCQLSNINISKYFLKLIDRHFNKDNPLSKI